MVSVTPDVLAETNEAISDLCKAKRPPVSSAAAAESGGDLQDEEIKSQLGYEIAKEVEAVIL